MEQKIKQWLLESLQACDIDNADVDPEVRAPKQSEHGDYTTNIALITAQKTGDSPRDLARRLIDAVAHPPEFQKVDIAGPGFINIYLSELERSSIIETILTQQEQFACELAGSANRVLVEFVSANPTGPLHVGHGRGAAYGAALVNLLRAAGHQVDSEYYVNDKGRQMNILALSVWFRYLALEDDALDLPAGCYQGDYVWDLAAELRNQHGDALEHPSADVLDGIAMSSPESTPEETEHCIDALIMRAKELLGERFAVLFDAALDAMLASIRNDLEHLGVQYTYWTSEREVVTDAVIAQTIALLEQHDALYEKEGAKWFEASAYGDEKDRVLVRANGEPTYFASDIAYHIEKLKRGYDTLINVWGADHHGYVARLAGALQAVGQNPEQLQVILVQFVRLYRDGVKASMSTRGGEFEPLASLRKEVGRDATCLFYLLCRYNQHVDFDVTLATSKSNENPVHYLQYAHARMCSVLLKLKEKGYPEFSLESANLACLDDPDSTELLKQLAQYRGVLRQAVAEYEPFVLLAYLRNLASVFHSYYNKQKFLVDDAEVRNARLALIKATGQIIKNGLNLLGVSAPESM